MKLVPISIREANRYVGHHHRHHRSVQGALFALAAEKDGQLVGVAIVGRPAPGLQDGLTAEVTRCCTDGTPNACSFLYARCRRALAALGYTNVKTYTRQSPSGWVRAGGAAARPQLRQVERRPHPPRQHGAVPAFRWGATV